MKIRVVETGDVYEAGEKDDLLEVLQRNSYPIATSCGGVASCGLCRVTVVAGAELLTPMKSQEVYHLGNVARIVGLRLACQTRAPGTGEVSISVPAVDDVEERKRSKADRARVERVKERAGRAGAREEGERRAESPLAVGAASASGPAHRKSVTDNARGARREPIEWRPRVLSGKKTEG